MIYLINRKDNILDDNIGFIENWDFSRANLDDKSRILAITQVASICYQNPKALGSESLYNKLIAESQGLPSSSFEFVPILLTYREWLHMYEEATNDLKDEYGDLERGFTLNIEKYGEWILDGKYLLTNFRALLHDVSSNRVSRERLKRFNTEFECDIIKSHFKVFLFKVDFPTRSQMVRHRVSWQELSRRYVSAKRVPNEFYISSDMENIECTYKYKYKGQRVDILITPDEVISMSNCLYLDALDKRVKPQSARRIIPQAGYTQLWGAFMPSQLENYLGLRLKSDSQYEIRQTAIAINELII